MSGPAPDPRVGRQRRLVAFLRVCLALVTVAAIVELLAPTAWRAHAGVAMVAVVIAVPLLRVAWLVARWWRRGDRRFAIVGAGLLLVVASSAVLH